MNSIEAARAVLRQRGWLTLVPGELREAMLARCRLLPAFERGQYLVRFRDEPDGIYGIVSGSFALQMAPNEQGPQTVHLYHGGSWVGELAYCLSAPRAACLIATRHSRSVFLHQADLQALTKIEPKLWRWIALCLAHNTNIALCGVDDMTIRSPQRRLAALLLRLGGLRPTPISEPELVPELDITQTDLSLMSNMSRTAVGDNLRRLEERGFVQCGYGTVVLCDAQGLRAWLWDTAEQRRVAGALDS